MIKEGLILNINNKQSIICIIDEYKGIKYVNVASMEEDNVYDIYRVEVDNNEEYLVKENDKDILEYLVTKWAMEYIQSSGVVNEE